MEDKSKQVTRIFEDLLIRDTKIRYPDPETGWLDGFVSRRVSFGVINDLNQAITVTPIGKVGAAEAALKTGTSVSANTEAIVSLNLDDNFAPAVSVMLQASTAPTTGAITVYVVSKE